MREKRFIIVAVLVLPLIGLWIACSHDSPMVPVDEPQVVEGDAGAALFEWAIGPIEGITTAWHPAPMEIFVPIGTTIQLKCGGGASADIKWVNAREIRRDLNGSIAEFQVAAGRQEVQVEIPGSESRQGGGGGTIKIEEEALEGASIAVHTCVINGVSATAKDFVVRELKVTAQPMSVSESSTNFETMRAFFSGGERYQIVSTLRQVGMNHYRTAIKRQITFEATASDPRYASLIEVRMPGVRPKLRTSFDGLFSEPGTYVVSVGPTANPRDVTIETYEVVITSHKSFETLVPENRVVTFSARTNPPGFESEIAWLASSKFGGSTPVVGRGAEFAVTFHDVWGLSDDGKKKLTQWLGVRADNAQFDQDFKMPAKSVTIWPPGPSGKGPVVGGGESLVLRAHCPAPAWCTPTPGADAPGVTGANVVCAATSACDPAGGGNAESVAENFRLGLIAEGCPAVKGPRELGAWQVLFSLGFEPSCTSNGASVAVSLENPGDGENFGTGGCPLLIDTGNTGSSSPASNAFFLNLEEGYGHDGQAIGTYYYGLTFTTSEGHPWTFSDASSNRYNAHSVDLGLWWNNGYYNQYGYVGTWTGVIGSWGRIDFNNQDGTYFQVRYCAASDFTLEAYDGGGNLIDSDTGPANLTYPQGVLDMGTLRVEAPPNEDPIAWVKVHDTGNYWVIDNIEGDFTGVGTVPVSISNVCNGVNADERAEWVSGYRITAP